MALFKSKILLVQVSPAPVPEAPMKLSAPPPNNTRPALAEVGLSKSMERMASVPSLMLALPVNVDKLPAPALRVNVPLLAFVSKWAEPDATTLPVIMVSAPP